MLPFKLVLFNLVNAYFITIKCVFKDKPADNILKMKEHKLKSEL